MPRYSMNQAVLAKKEGTYATDATPAGASDAVLVSNLSVNTLNAQNVGRNLIRNYFGASEQLVGSAYKSCSFDVEFQNGGTAGTAAAWDSLLQACGFSAGSPLTTPSRVEHSIAAPASAASLTIYYYDDGVLHKLLGARGTFSLDLTVGSRPVFKFQFIGLDGGDTAVAVPSTTLTGYKAPLAVTDTNTGAIVLGATYATGALTGGTEYISGGLTLDFGANATFIDLLGTATLAGQTVEITGRETVGKINFDLTAANEVTFMTNVKANTTQSLGFVHGTTAGFKMMGYAPAVQLINPRKEDKNGRRLIGFDMRLLPSSGNDEFKLIAL